MTSHHPSLEPGDLAEMKESATQGERGSCLRPLRDWQLVLVFYAAAVIMRLVLMAFYVRVPWIFNDELRYIREARSLALYRQFGIDGFPTFFDRPLYPLLISLFGRMPETDLALIYIRVFNVLLMSTTVWATWWLGRQVLTRKGSLWAAAIVAVWPLGFFASVVMSENLLFPLATLTCGAMCWGWSEWLGKEGKVSVARQLLLAVLLGAIYYTHARGLLFIGAFPLLMGWFSLRRGIGEARGARRVWYRWPVDLLKSLLRAIWEWRYTILPILAVIVLWVLRDKLAVGPGGSDTGSVSFGYYNSYLVSLKTLFLHPGFLIGHLLKIAGYYWSAGFGIVGIGALVFLLSKPRSDVQYVLWVLVVALLAMHMGLAACQAVRYMRDSISMRLQGRYVAAIWPLLVVAGVWALSRCRWGWRIAVAASAGFVLSYFFPALNVLRMDALHDLSDMILYKYLMYLPGATLWRMTCVLILLGASCWVPKRREILGGSFILLFWASAQWMAFREGGYRSRSKHVVPMVQMARRVELLAGGAGRTLTILIDRKAKLPNEIMYCKFYSQARFVRTDVDGFLRDASKSPSGRLVPTLGGRFSLQVPPKEVREAELLLARRDVRNVPLIFRSGHLRLYQLRPVVFPRKMSPGRLAVRVPSEVKAGHNVLLPVVVENRSTSAWWHEGPYQVVVRHVWETPEGKPLYRQYARPLTLGKPLYPGGRRVLQAFVVPPKRGRYRLRWRIVCTGHRAIELVAPCVFEVEARP